MPQTTVCVFREAAGEIPFAEWLDALAESEPRPYFKCLEMIARLAQLGNELRRPTSDVLRDGIRELRAKIGTVNYRVLYFFCGKNAVCLSHGLTKEGRVPDADIDRAVKRKKLVATNPDRYTADFQV
jgi:phage-related protein